MRDELKNMLPNGETNPDWVREMMDIEKDTLVMAGALPPPGGLTVNSESVLSVATEYQLLDVVASDSSPHIRRRAAQVLRARGYVDGFKSALEGPKS